MNSELNINNHPNLDTAVIRAICQSEIEGGVSLNQLPIGARVEVETKNTTYVIENRGEGHVLISGHPILCPKPMLVDFHGSTWGTPLLKTHFIGRGMQMEFHNPEIGLVHTTKVRDIRELGKPASTPRASLVF
jgi:hypothetical protein